MIKGSIHVVSTDLGELLLSFSLCRVLGALTFSEEEDGPVLGTVDDGSLFERFVGERPSGFFVHGRSVLLSARSLGEGYSSVDFFWAEVAPSTSDVERLARCAGQHQIRFGYFCEEEEQHHRNRSKTRLSAGLVEAWLGRSSESSLPGLYWRTIASTSFCAEHGVALDEIRREATKASDFGDLVLLEMFDEPQEWMKESSRLDALCARIRGVFSIAGAADYLAAATDFLNYRQRKKEIESERWQA